VVPAPDPDATFAPDKTQPRACRLDRNFPAEWKPWSSETCAQGPYPLSEPETRSIARLLTQRSNVGAVVLLSRGIDLHETGTPVEESEIERILFAPVTRREVIAYERALPGYKDAGYPSTDDEAIAFKTGLVQRLIDDGDSLRKQWRNAEIDLNAAYRGQVGMMIEQQDKVNLAVTGEEESRYANITLADLRNNLDGTQNIYALFRDWIHSKAAGGSSDSKIQARFDELATIYLTGDALPEVPPGWAADHPTPENLATPFGVMWQTVHESVDPGNESSVVFELNQIASLLGLTASPEP
jgi:iron uptake system component EfeO